MTSDCVWMLEKLGNVATGPLEEVGGGIPQSAVLQEDLQEDETYVLINPSSPAHGSCFLSLI